MKFTTPFNADIIRIEQKLVFKEMYGPSKRKNNKVLIPAFGFLLLGLLTFLFLPQSTIISAILLAAVGTHYLVNQYNYRVQVSKAKEEHQVNVEEMISFEEKRNIPTVIEFREDEFYYENSASSASIVWEWFDEYKVLDDIISIKHKGQIAYMISKAQYSDEDFDEMLKFISKKISKNSDKAVKSDPQSNPELIDDNSL
ncbi:MAG: hypothetical protein ACJASQ_000411 [Crocinitomicaceae bacterium]|jgi:hypothetical protein